MHEPNDFSRRSDPFKLFYRFYAIVAVVLGLLWLSIYKQEIHNVAKLTLVVAGMSWSQVPRLKGYGLGWFVPKTGGLTSGQKFFLVVSLLFSIFGCTIVLWQEFTLSLIHI